MPTYNFTTDRKLYIDGQLRQSLEGPIVFSPRTDAGTFTLKSLDRSDLFYYSGNNIFEIDGEEFEGTVSEFCDDANALYTTSGGGSGEAYPDVSANESVELKNDKVLSFSTELGDEMLKIESFSTGDFPYSQLTIGEVDGASDAEARGYLLKYANGAEYDLKLRMLTDYAAIQANGYEGSARVFLEASIGGFSEFVKVDGNDGIALSTNTNINLSGVVEDAATTKTLTLDGSNNVRWKSAATGYTVSTQTSNYLETATSGEVIILVDSSAGTVNISLPPVASSTAKITVKKIHADNSVIIGPDFAETLDGAADITLTGVNDSVTLVTDGANWFTIASTGI